jgi:predicted TPR repeat methyltransferase
VDTRGTDADEDAADAASRVALLATGPDTAAVRHIYDQWAATYDEEDVAALMGYPAPARVADRVAELVGPETDILDAGCGTGLLGAALAPYGFRSIDGLDLSPGMLRVARRRRVYHDLGPADLRFGVPGRRRSSGSSRVSVRSRRATSGPTPSPASCAS